MTPRIQTLLILCAIPAVAWWLGGCATTTHYPIQVKPGLWVQEPQVSYRPL